MIRSASRGLKARLAVAIAALAMIGSGATTAQTQTEHQCYAEYSEAKLASEVELSGQAPFRVTTRINLAWTAFYTGKGVTYANSRLAEAIELIRLPQITGVSPTSKAVVEDAVMDLRACINDETPDGLAELTVNVFLMDESAEGNRGAPAGEDVRIFVNNEPVARTDANGQAVLSIPGGTSTVTAIVPSTAIAEAEVTVAAGGTASIDLVLDDGKEVVSEATAVVSAFVDDTFPRSASEFLISLTNMGVVRPILDVSHLYFEDASGSFIFQLMHEDGRVSVTPSGTISVADPQALFDSLAQEHHGRKITLVVGGVDANGYTLEARRDFYLQNQYVEVQLTAPPSMSQLPLASVDVQYELMGAGLSIIKVSNGTGIAVFGLMPRGNTILTARTVHNGREYHGEAMFFATSGTRVNLVMRHADDIVAGVPPYTLTPANPGANSPTSMPPADAERAALHQQILPAIDLSQVANTSETVNLRVSANQANIVQQGSVTLTAPQGTSKLFLSYFVQTAEYPQYVLAQSIYNDTWSLSLLAQGSGQQFYSISRNVNSQLSGDPSWNSSGRTAQIEESYDISDLTASQSATFVLTASAMNVGDGLLPTVVDASASIDESRLVVKNVRLENQPSAVAGAQTNISFPLQGEINSRQRWFTMNVDLPDGATITRVKAEVLSSANTSPLVTLYDEAAGQNVQVLDGGVVRARATRSVASELQTVSPPAHNITYRFTVYANNSEGVEISGEATSNILRALWRMQEYWRNPARRYGARDPGHDDWLNARTWSYLQNHGNLLTRIDDISGEHGRNIGHATHETGADIDLYHTHQFPGAVRGQDNYLILAETLGRAMALPAAQTIADRQNLAQWIATTRTTFAAVLDTTDAETIFYSIGSPTTRSGVALPNGWARQLLINGNITVGTRTYDSGLGAWGYPQNRLIYNAVHNSHWHIKRPRDR